MKDYRVSVFNTITKKYEMVTVTEEVYQVYMRDEWNIKKSTSRFYEHQITDSYISKGSVDMFEDLDAYVGICEDSHKKEVENAELHNMLSDAMKVLSTSDRNLIHALFYEGYTEKEYAEKIGINQSNVHRRKKKILDVLRKELEKFS